MLSRILGGSGASLRVAVLYTNVVFAGAVAVWSVNLLAASLRGDPARWRSLGGGYRPEQPYLAPRSRHGLAGRLRAGLASGCASDSLALRPWHRGGDARGTNVGAGQFARARRIAWTGALMAAVFAEVIGLAAALALHAWLGLFTREPAVLAAGTLYLRTVAPFYGCVGLGILLYFAAQGAGRVSWPFVAGSVRLLVAAGLGWLAVTRLGVGLNGLFIAVALSSVLFATLNAVAAPRGGGRSAGA